MVNCDPQLHPVHCKWCHPGPATQSQWCHQENRGHTISQDQVLGTGFTLLPLTTPKWTKYPELRFHNTWDIRWWTVSTEKWETNGVSTAIAQAYCLEFLGCTSRIGTWTEPGRLPELKIRQQRLERHRRPAVTGKYYRAGCCSERTQRFADDTPWECSWLMISACLLKKLTKAMEK